MSDSSPVQRVIPMRFAPLIVAGFAVLLSFPVGSHPVLADWLVAFASAVLSMCGGRWPLPTVLGQSALLVAATFTGHIGRDVVQMLAAFALVELLMRRKQGWQRWIAVPIVTAATALDLAQGTGARVPHTIFWTVLIVASACGLGVYLFSLRLWMVRYHEKFQEAERLRESENLAVRTIERATIARELHDLVAHHVASIVLRVGVARHVELTAEDARAVLDDVHETGTEALAQLRELVGVLRDPAAMHADPHLPLLEPADLRSALDTVVDRVRKAGLPVESDIADDLTGLDAVRRLAVLRIAQESLTNALRHACGATLAHLTVRIEDGDVLVEVGDNGSGGFGGAGHGLIGLTERVQLIGGSFVAGPGEEGWYVRARLTTQ
ncbi:MAG TPA: histidine kinase [Pseudonocardiaceae bacterium]|nr:histidine kinase [Pseudonocardiaceae bacterium]